MQYFGVPRCPYCRKRVNLIRTWSLKRQGEYKCPRCGGISNVFLSPLVYVFALLAVFCGGAVYFFHRFILNDIDLFTGLQVIIPFGVFFLLSLFMVYLEKPVIKKVEKKGRKRKGPANPREERGRRPAPVMADPGDHLPPNEYPAPAVESAPVPAPQRPAAQAPDARRRQAARQTAAAAPRRAAPAQGEEVRRPVTAAPQAEKPAAQASPSQPAAPRAAAEKPVRQAPARKPASASQPAPAAAQPVPVAQPARQAPAPAPVEPVKAPAAPVATRETAPAAQAPQRPAQAQTQAPAAPAREVTPVEVPAFGDDFFKKYDDPAYIQRRLKELQEKEGK